MRERAFRFPAIVTVLGGAFLMSREAVRAEDEPAAPTPLNYGHHKRSLGGRHNIRVLGGTGRTEHAVTRGLAWLAKQQKDDGIWGDASDDGLALLAFLGAGYTDRGTMRENKYAAVVRRGLDALLRRQDKAGGLGRRNLQRHTIATLALCEAYWMTKSPRYKAPAEKALRFLESRRKQKDGTWSEDARINLWGVLAYEGGRFAGLAVEPAARAALLRWAKRGGGKTDAERASAYLARIWLGTDPRDKSMRRLAPWITIVGMRTADDWLHGTQAFFQTAGRQWIAWNKVMKESVVGSQKRDGSWGSVADTARYTMCLQVYYRYARFFARPPTPRYPTPDDR